MDKIRLVLLLPPATKDGLIALCDLTGETPAQMVRRWTIQRVNQEMANENYSGS